MGCVIWGRKYTRLRLGFLLCTCSGCYRNPQATKSFKQFVRVIRFPLWLMTILFRISGVDQPVHGSNQPYETRVFTLREIEMALPLSVHAIVHIRRITHYLHKNSFIFFPTFMWCLYPISRVKFYLYSKEYRCI